MKFSAIVLLSALAGVLVGCKGPTVQSRRAERLVAYNALSQDQRDLVDKGQIKVGMNADAVYIAWGPPSEVLESETQAGRETIWIYHGQSMEESRFWAYREVSQDGTVFLERYLDSEFYPKNYIRAEIVFTGGAVARWRTFAKPL